MPSKTTITLTPTSVRFRDISREERSRKTYLDDGKVPDDKGGSMRGLMLRFLRSRMDKVYFFEDESSGMRVISVDDSVPSQIHGIVKCGKFGIESELVDINHIENTKTREKTDCELIPFFYLMEFNARGDEIILVTEGFGIYGAKACVTSHIRSFLRETLPNFRMEASNIVDGNAMKTATRESAKAVRLCWNRAPHDIADSIGIGAEDEEESEIELIVRKRGGFMRLPEWIPSGRIMDGYLVDNFGRKPDFAKVTVSMNGKDKVVRTDMMEMTRMSFDLTDSAELGANGHPTEQFMLDESRDVIAMARRVLDWD